MAHTKKHLLSQAPKLKRLPPVALGERGGQEIPIAFMSVCACVGIIPAVEKGNTTAAVQEYLNALAGIQGESQAEPIVRALLARAVDRLHLLCSHLLHKSYPRLTRGPMNLCSEEMLSAV